MVLMIINPPETCPFNNDVSPFKTVNMRVEPEG